MPDNPSARDQTQAGADIDGNGALPGLQVLQASGRDAAAFLQAQCMNDVAALGDGHWQWNGWLTPKGRVIALFALLRLDAQTFSLLSSDFPADALATRLQRYVFRSKLALQARDDLHVTGAFAAPAQARLSRFAGTADSGLELDFGGDGGPRTLRIDRQPPSSGADFDARWTTFDLMHGLPRLAGGQSEQWTPQQLSLQRLDAFSVKKGCYPGQEIVARTHFLGQAKRGLVLLDADAEIHAGSEVRGGDQALGTVVSAAAHAARALALAVLPLERDATSMLHAGNIALRERALQGGLAR